MKAEEWDRRYAAAEGGLFGDAPNLYLRAILSRPDCAPRSALVLADGDGRNGTWLAAQGLAVTAVDLSAEATRRAEARDRAAGVAAERAVADLAEWAPGPRRWDMAAILFLHGPATLRRRTIETAAAALAPGGWLVLEGFGLGQAGGGMGPDDPAYLYDLDALRGWAAGLALVEALEGVVALDEGPRHAGEAAVVRVTARRL
ncbi:MAG: class I SAM-dependent methyltransferase [Rhodobacteraceae bacterium]|nr:MAG: class I SAM-dependent methyltransferase [Paracoccaceae bacterium]